LIQAAPVATIALVALRERSMSNGKCRFPKALLLIVVVVAAIGFNRGCVGRGTWANSEEEIDLPALGVHTVLIRTDNGTIQVRPTRGDSDTIHVRAIIRAAGSDENAAQACLDAVDIITPTSGPADSVQEIRWAWSDPNWSSQKAEVSFEVSLPAALDLNVETENGKIDVVGATGDCELKSRNGAIRAWAVAAQRISASTQNGAIDIESPAGEIDLTTTNGKIVAALTGTTVSKGTLKTQNGEIRLSIDPAANVQFRCKTNNGRITNSLPLGDVKKSSRRGLTGQLGDSGGTIDVSSNNGAIRLEKIDPRRVERSDEDE